MSSATLFKYRALGNWKFLIDILVNQRLYAAPFNMLNDPMEGRFYYFNDAVTRAFRKAIKEQKRELRICSLTRDPLNTLMWSYYAEGHSGVALGLTIDKRRSQAYEVRNVKYDNQVSIGMNHATQEARDVALSILSQKQQYWTHEKEVRVFSQHPYVPIQLKEIRLGCKTSKDDEELLQSLLTKLNLKTKLSRVNRDHLDMPLDEVDPPDHPR